MSDLYNRNVDKREDPDQMLPSASLSIHFALNSGNFVKIIKIRAK